MSNSSSNNASESKRPRPDCANDDPSNPEEQLDYYYDDATGYETYEDDEDEDEERED
jgi:hypothetical protein